MYFIGPYYNMLKISLKDGHFSLRPLNNHHNTLATPLQQPSNHAKHPSNPIATACQPHKTP